MNLKTKSFFSKLNHIRNEFNHQNNILYAGLDGYRNLLIWTLPLFLSFIFSLIDYFISISIKSVISNLLSILPSLIGFLIASLTILISMDNKLLNLTVYDKKTDKTPETNPTYRQVGASLFLYATKISLLLIIIAFIMPDSYPSNLIQFKLILLIITKLVIFVLFSKLLVSIFYGLLFLSSAIENHDEITEEDLK